MRHSRPPALCAFLFLACLPLGCSRAAKQEEEKKPPAPVKWEGIREIFLEEWTELAGVTQPLPDHAARVTSPVAGQVHSVLPATTENAVALALLAGGVVLPVSGGKGLAEGQLLKEGDVLVELDATAVLANLHKAEAQKLVLEADREVAAIAVELAAQELKSLNELKGKPDMLVPAVLLKKASLALDSARGSLKAIDRKLEAAEQDKAALNLELKLYKLTAPRAGRLGRLQVVLGQTLSAGAPVAELVDIEDEIDVLCYVSAGEARKLQVGQPAHIGGFDPSTKIDTSGDPEGKVVYVADQAEPETGLFALKVRFANREMKLRASSVVRVRVLTQPERFCLAVADSALMEDQDPPGIIVVEEDETPSITAEGKEEKTGKARRLNAVIGVRDRNKKFVEIVRLEEGKKEWPGLNAKTLVVIEKGQSLQTGDKVKLEEEDEDEEPEKKD
jgi:multidrug efflux pump subunit AcrA (membrane-fusion protein)